MEGGGGAGGEVGGALLMEGFVSEEKGFALDPLCGSRWSFRRTGGAPGHGSGSG